MQNVVFCAMELCAVKQASSCIMEQRPVGAAHQNSLTMEAAGSSEILAHPPTKLQLCHHQISHNKFPPL
jgi:hypothetical protein